MAEPARLVEVVRSGYVESVHRGSVAVATPDGELVAWAGDPEARTFARSSMKPLQAAVSLSLASEDELTDAEVAVAAASHNAESVHLEAVAAILDRAGLSFTDLRTPPSLPLDPEEARAAAGPAPELHNCSGKHAAMLLACVRQGWETETYPDRAHPLQRAIQDAVRLAGGEEPDLAVDGCGIPVHAVSLGAIATLYARLGRGDALGALAPFAGRVLGAMRAEPYLVAGRNRACTDLMREAPGVVAKVGAEGVFCAVIPSEGLGVAVKIEDGASRAAPPALLHTLRELGVLEEAAAARLGAWTAPPVLGGGEPVGVLRAAFELERA
ncbi:MAG: asparaginase [Actinomycetota bacterium]